MGVNIFNTWFTYSRNSFNHDHIKNKSLNGTFSFYLFGLFKEALATILTKKNICFGNWQIALK
jgi:hypothetical protein